MPNQPTREEYARAELRDAAAKARMRAAADLESGRDTPAWITALAATRT